MAPTVLRTAGGKLDIQDEAAFHSLVDRISTGAPKILLHVHGGLVNQGAAEQKATILSGTGEQAYNAPEDWEQVYLVWRTGFFETLRENWTDLARNDQLYNALLKRLLSFVSGKLKILQPNGTRSAAFAQPLTIHEIERRLASGSDDPFGDVAAHAGHASARLVLPVEDEAELQFELKAALEKDTALTDIAEDIGAAVAARLPSEGSSRDPAGNPAEGAAALARLDGAIRAELELNTVAPGATRSFSAAKVAVMVVRYGVKVGLAVLHRFRDERDHGLHATVAEEIARTLYGDKIGAAVWGAMVGDAGDHFGPGRLGTRLMSAIANNPQARLVFVGHSAGSILATELLAWAAQDEPGLRVDLVLLAPAVRMSKFADMLNAAAPCIRSFRMFLMSDELERRDAVLGKGWGFIYPSSLLYAVSGLFEVDGKNAMPNAPLLGMHQFHSALTPWLGHQHEGAAIRSVKEFLGNEVDRVVVSKSTGRPGLGCTATSHGGFDEDPETLRSITTLLG